jgi:outer membrane protein assembly factor BamB
MSRLLDRFSLTKCSTAVRLIACFALSLLTSSLVAQEKSTRPRFVDDVAKIKANLDKNTLRDPILFVGSSTIRMWNLGESFPNIPCLNHGFGGSVLDDIEDHFDTVIGPVACRGIVMYCGDNDLASGKTAIEHAAQVETMLTRIRAAHPNTPLLWIGIKPSGKRWSNWPEIQKANSMVAQVCRQWPLVRFIDVTPITLNEQGVPDDSLFKEDKLHLNEKGYQRWNALLQPYLVALTTATQPARTEFDFQWAWNNAEMATAGKRFWPQFRGPAGDGVVRGSSAPTEWNEQKNVVWKLPIEGRAWSSPVVWGNRIWLTNASDDGRKMSVIVVDFESGKVQMEIPLFENETVQSDHHKVNSYASPTPILDREHAYISFGAYGTACLNQEDGKVVWVRKDLPCNHFRGPGSSPIFYRNLMIFHMDGFDYKYVVALDRQTGETVWKVDRQVDYGTDDGDVHKAYATPTLIEVAGEIQMISPTSKATIAYDPATGKELWRVRYKEFSTTAKPMYDGETLYLNSGFSKAILFAVKPGSGDLTDKILWSQDRGIGSKPSQVLLNNLIFNVDDDGIASCIDATNGEQVWQKRLGGEYSASVMAVGNRIYLFDHDGKSYVFAGDRSGTLVAENLLDDGCMASPAVVDGNLIVRTRTALYRIGVK